MIKRPGTFIVHASLIALSLVSTAMAQTADFNLQIMQAQSAAAESKVELLRNRLDAFVENTEALKRAATSSVVPCERDKSTPDCIHLLVSVEMGLKHGIAEMKDLAADMASLKPEQKEKVLAGQKTTLGRAAGSAIDMVGLSLVLVSDRWIPACYVAYVEQASTFLTATGSQEAFEAASNSVSELARDQYNKELDDLSTPKFFPQQEECPVPVHFVLTF